MRRALGDREEFLSEAVGIYRVHHSRNLVVRSRLYPGVVEVLEHFRPIPMAVISNKTSEFVLPLLDGLKISRYFSRVLGADSGLPLKPAPEAVQKIMAEFRAPHDRTVMVGDGTTDVRAGKAAGVITCSVTYGFRSEDELRRAGPDHVMHSLSELTALFAPEARK